MENSIALLCDIGNTSYFFQDAKGRMFKESVASFDPSSVKEKVYYISVNSALEETLASLENWVNLHSFVERENYYETMGIDRICVVEAVENGVIIDAGSAITVDVVRDGIFEGGFIYPGVKAMQETYKGISPALHYEFNFSLNLAVLPKNSQDAISYGYLKGFYEEVKRHHLPIIVTGGDAPKMKKLFPQAELESGLIFKGMQKILERKHNLISF